MRIVSSQHTDLAQPRRLVVAKVLGALPLGLIAAFMLLRPRWAFSSSEPWTVDRWAGRARRLSAAPQREPVCPHRALGGLIEPVHVDPLPELPATEHFEGRPPPFEDRPSVASTTQACRQKRSDRKAKPSAKTAKPTGITTKPTGRVVRPAGQGMIELLIAAPVILFAGLVIVQVVLLMQARQALRLGALEAARAASVAHADPQAALQGLARGLAPWWIGAQSAQDALTAPLQTQVHLTLALAQGRLRITPLAPSRAAFADWAVPARDDAGQMMEGQQEIPNDALRIRATETQPNTPAPGLSDGQPIGARSGQTLLQANVFRLQIDYVVPLRVPVAGHALAALARAWQTDPGMRSMASAQGVPVRVSAAVRMQSPARHAAPSDD